MALLMVAALTLTAGCTRLPGLGRSAPGRAERPAALAVSAPSGRLQETPPPGAVQQFSAELDGRQPQVRIVAPSDGTLLPAGPWPLTLAVQDWPLVDAGPLGLGSHLVVQIDDGPPQRIAGSPGGPTADRQPPQEQRLELELPELTPGSHRLSVYAARPWGEAVKRPGAFEQIQLHRVAATPQTQPAAGSAQLIAVSPGGQATAEPVLLDWLLRDAPLQGLREGDGRWRLRITVNGDSFLVDQNSPLWLKGFRPGSNSVVLELLDGLGEPLNPPFNTAVREVVIDPQGPRSPWLQSSLSAAERLQLLGLGAVAQPELAPEPQAASPSASTAPADAAAPAASAGSASSATEPSTAEPSTAETTTAEKAAAENASATATPPAAATPPGTDQQEAEDEEALDAGAGADEPGQGEPSSPVAEATAAKAERAADDKPGVSAAAAAGVDAVPEPETATNPAATAADPAPPAAATAPAAAALAEALPSIPSDVETPMAPDQIRAGDSPGSGDRLQPGSSLGGSARELVREDGSLIRSEPQGWLGRLSGRLQR